MIGSEVLKEKVDADKMAFRQEILNTQRQIKSLKSAIADKQAKLKDYEKREKELLNMTLGEFKKSNP